MWFDEGDDASDVLQVNFECPELKTQDWLKRIILNWRLVISWRVRLVWWKEVWPCIWRWARNIRGIIGNYHMVQQHSFRWLVGVVLWALWKRLSPTMIGPMCTIPVCMAALLGPFSKPTDFKKLIFENPISK